MRRPGTNAFRLLIVALLVILSAFGVPAIVSFAQPRRDHDDSAIVLVAGEQVPLI